MNHFSVVVFKNLGFGSTKSTFIFRSSTYTEEEVTFSVNLFLGVTFSGNLFLRVTFSGNLFLRVTFSGNLFLRVTFSGNRNSYKVRMLADPKAELVKALGLDIDLTSTLGDVR